MKEISLLHTTERALVDDDDFERVSQYRWGLARHRKSHTAYAQGIVNGTLVLMHRFILGDSAPPQVDHRDRNGLNNQRMNLRAATSSQNKANRPKFRSLGGRTPTSSFKGVCKIGHYHATGKGRFQAEIKVRGKGIFLGMFDDEVKAARAYDEAARKYFGEFAYVNFPEQAAE